MRHRTGNKDQLLSLCCNAVSLPQDRTSIMGKCCNCENGNCRLRGCPKPKDLAKIQADPNTMPDYINKLREKGSRGIKIAEIADIVDKFNEVIRAVNIFSSGAK